MIIRTPCISSLVFIGLVIVLVRSELLPSLELKPTGYVNFKNETKTKTARNCFSLYLQLDDEVQDKQHIISIRSESRTEQFIKVSLIQMRLSVLANLRHPAVSRWFMVGKEFVPNEVYYIKIDQNGTDIHITINNVTTSESLESVEDFIYPAEIVIGNASPTRGVNGSIAGLVYNGVSTLTSYLRRDDDFRNVAVQMGGEVTVKEKDWITIDERNKKYCSHTNHFPKSEVGTEITLENCQQNIARAICGENQIWLVEKCNEDGKSVKGRSEEEENPQQKSERFPKKYLIIYIGAGASAILFITIIIIAVLVKRSRRNKVHRYKMAKNVDYRDDYNPANFPNRLNGISTLPALKHDSLTTKPRPSSMEISCSTLDNPASDIMDNRIPVFAATTNPLSKPEDLYPVYLTSEPNPERDSDIISTILGERAERNYTNQFNNASLMPNSLLNSNSGLNSEMSSWQDV
ncbi:uncharacterized protein LOC134815281 isoform X1 [Bolinopsis microptera]|uniref:uncharacterized protein LOC134815281 isoform X1 n=1 Tax=Bolinopsis microptera TaxID=2820187 RepID=UPI00307A3E20